jgi:hypothetical protein
MFDDYKKDHIGYMVKELREFKEWSKVELASFLVQLLELCLDGYFGDAIEEVKP